MVTKWCHFGRRRTGMDAEREGREPGPAQPTSRGAAACRDVSPHRPPSLFHLSPVGMLWKLKGRAGPVRMKEVMFSSVLPAVMCCLPYSVHFPCEAHKASCRAAHLWPSVSGRAPGAWVQHRKNGIVRRLTSKGACRAALADLQPCFSSGTRLTGGSCWEEARGTASCNREQQHRLVWLWEHKTGTLLPFCLW